MKSIKSIRIPEGIVRQLKLNGVVLWKQNILEQLTAPTITLDGDTLTMTATDSRTQELVIFVDGVETTTVENEKEETPDTPTEEYTLSGTWYFNETIDIHAENNHTEQVSFVSDGYEFNGVEFGKDYLTYTQPDEQEPIAPSMYDAAKGGWLDEAYRTITFDGVQTVSKEFKEWLEANAERQTITFTIYGMQYTALSGMTWGEWVESEYNTLPYTTTLVTDAGYIITYSDGKSNRYTVRDGDNSVFVDDLIKADYAYTQTNKPEK